MRKTRKGDVGRLGMEREDYLQAIYRLERAEGQARISDIARSLEVSKPSASQMMLRLKKEGFVVYAPYVELRLTPKGRRAALDVLDRREAITEFLATLGISKKIQERDVHGIEHYLSAETTKKLRAVTKFLKEFDGKK